MAFILPKKWMKEEFERAAQIASEAFAESRKHEGIEHYLILFDAASNRLEKLFEASDDLLELKSRAPELFADGYLEEVRYLASPPVSEDDLKILSEVGSVSYSAITIPENVQKIMDVISLTMDPMRFPWTANSRKPTQQERETAIVSTASLMASQKTKTKRMNRAKELQENAVAAYLETLDYKEVPRRPIRSVADAPRYLEYCRESRVAGKKADIVAGLGDNRFLAIECKVSNSEVNSYKRLNHETIEKVTHWNTTFGTAGVVGAAVLSGVFKVANLIDAQDAGVAIFWSYDLSPLGDFITATVER